MQGEGVGVYPGAGVTRHHAQLLPQRARAEHGHALPEGDAHRALVDADVRGLGAELDAVNLVAGPERDEADGHEGGARGGAVAERHQRPRRGEVVHSVRRALGARQQAQALHLAGGMRIRDVNEISQVDSRRNQKAIEGTSPAAEECGSINSVSFFVAII